MARLQRKLLVFRLIHPGRRDGLKKLSVGKQILHFRATNHEPTFPERFGAATSCGARRLRRFTAHAGTRATKTLLPDPASVREAA